MNGLPTRKKKWDSANSDEHLQKKYRKDLHWL